MFRVEAGIEGEGRLFRVGGGGAGESRLYRLSEGSQQDYLDFHAALARDFGTRMPRNRLDSAPPEFDAQYQPLLTSNAGRGILYGYGDPAVVRTGAGWHLLVTSNDAPDAFPILRSRDLEQWEHAGFAFPRGATPAWTLAGEEGGDFWAPELAPVGDRWLLCFSAREEDGSLAIGLATAPTPEGPFTPQEMPLLRGGVIDAHIFTTADGGTILFWKEDSNAVWPRMLAAMLHRQPMLAERLFDTERDRRTAAFAGTLWPWIEAREPMEQFFALQPLIEAGIEHFSLLRERLAELGTVEADEAMQAMRTPVFAQHLSPDRLELVGERHIVLVNDLHWEGHLIEGPFVTEQQGRYWLFYSGNDFSTAEYGIGVAVADTPLGPYRKFPQPLLRSTPSWSGPGHPSVAPGRDGEPRLFFHAFLPRRAGYKEFRALLTARLDFSEEGVAVSR